VAAEMIVSDEAFAYLAVQRGRINDLRHDRAAWQGAYEASLAEDMADLEPWLPERCTAILDIGSGLGGIDVHLARHYIAPELWLLDGDAGLPPVIEAAVPFNDMSAARRFLGAHGIDLTGWITPHGPHRRTQARGTQHRPRGQPPGLVLPPPARTPTSTSSSCCAGRARP
jgi:hypothetical protein